MGFSLWHLILVLVIVFVLFGAGKLPAVMADVGKGIKSLKDAMNGEAETAAPTKAEEKKSASNVQQVAFEEVDDDPAPKKKPASKPAQKKKSA
ncbi:MAG: twin-arginine translocase TatA/TatE family subunit [Proteobacteria bacterium]|nr:twin-arginine translocase TatA/TatE family subunit [Pseudomonadota bacterium]